MAKKMIVANWKMNNAFEEADQWLGTFIDLYANNKDALQNLDIVICPPSFLVDYLDSQLLDNAFDGLETIMLAQNKQIEDFSEEEIADIVVGQRPFWLGAQDCHFENAGSFTGDLSAEMVKKIGADYVILGHSERRENHFETDEIIAKKVAAVMIAIAFIDYFYQRWEFEKSMRMSKQEVKDEYKQSEGDPHIKGKQKQKMRQMSMGQVRQAVPDASAVVSNPTHYAIGIQYEDGMQAPKIVAKGRDELAIYIKQVAKEHDIPIFEDPPLARGLYGACELGDFIHPDFYVAIAKIIAHILKLKGGEVKPPEEDSIQPRSVRMSKGMSSESRTDLGLDDKPPGGASIKS